MFNSPESIDNDMKEKLEIQEEINEVIISMLLSSLQNEED